jgi:hypothetical protein
MSHTNDPRRILAPRALLLGLALPALAVACGGDGETDEVQRQLDQVRAAVDPFHDVGAAVAAGYVPLGECVESPEGGMGIHYGHPSKLMAAPSLEDPPLLLYVPDGERLKLAGVEYFVPVMVDGAPYLAPEHSPPPAGFAPATPPELFAGHPFDGPMPGHEEDMPWHYDQHVWLFEANPAGMFAAWNTAISCPQ